MMLILTMSVGMASMLATAMFVVGNPRRRGNMCIARFRHVLADRSACCAPYSGTNQGPGFAAYRLTNCRTSSAASGPANDCTSLAITLGGCRSTHTATHRPTDNGACLAADRLANGRAGNSTQPTAGCRFKIAGHGMTRGNHQCTDEEIRNFHVVAFLL